MRWLLTACALYALAGPCWATTHIVLPDGTGDFATIQAAIDAAVDGDIIELTNGTFTGPGNRDIDYHGKGITVRSQAGDPEQCLIDCQGSPSEPHRGLLFNTHEDSGSVLEGVTITNGRSPTSDDGGGVKCIRVSPVFRNCILRSNSADGMGGGMSIYQGTPSLIGCEFVDNTVDHLEGGGLYCESTDILLNACVFSRNSANFGAAVSARASVTHFRDCVFLNNTAITGGGLILSGNTATLSGCTLVGNSASAGGAISCEDQADVELSHCTFHANRGNGEAVHVFGGSHVLMENVIIAFSQGLTDAIFCSGPGANTVSLSCCDLYGNGGGDWDQECIHDQPGTDGNISEDPLFCDPASDDLTLDCASPCAPEHDPECGRIGAWPVGCGVSPAKRITWGALKQEFSR
jgi:predicted outer membrane repeat protein